MRIPQIRLWGVRIHSLTLTRALSRASALSAPVTVFTPNALMLEAARRDRELQALLNTATLSLPDGRGVLWAAKRRGTPLSCRVAGIDFGHALLQKAAEEGRRVFLLGGKPGVALVASEKLQQELPSLVICGTHHGYFTKEEEPYLLSEIQAAAPYILLVCMGFPRQEKWVAEHLPRLDGIQAVACLGGSLDVWSGALSRAPLWVQRLGLEWAFRMLREPKRLFHLPILLSFWFRSVLLKPK